MNVTIQPGSSLPLLSYRVELITSPQSFYHTAIQLTGSFGRIMLTKIDLRNCTIWIAEYHITEPVTLHGFINKMLFQVYFPLPLVTVSLDEKDYTHTATEPSPLIYLSATDRHSVDLPVTGSRMLFIHYTREYFNGNGSGINETIIDIFSPQKNEPVAFPVNAAICTVIRQIINASPANRVIHLYLEAKVKELLTLLWQLANPDAPATAISPKEIETVQQVKNIIMADLSRSYNSFELSRLTSTNAYTLKTNFKIWFGIPLHHFLHNCRMEKATELLLTTALSVKEIAFTVGYKNVSNFSESFKNYYGYPPSKLREPG